MCITLLCNAIDSAAIAEHDVLDSSFSANVLDLLWLAARRVPGSLSLLVQLACVCRT